MTTPHGLDTSPARTGGLGVLVRRHAGLLATSPVAQARMALALRQPDTTYHFERLIVASSWGVVRRWVAAGPGSPAEA